MRNTDFGSHKRVELAYWIVAIALPTIGPLRTELVAVAIIAIARSAMLVVERIERHPRHDRS